MIGLRKSKRCTAVFAETEAGSLDNSFLGGLVILMLLLCSVSFGQSIIIYPGSPNDTGFSTPSTTYTIPTFVSIPTLPPGTNTVMRYAVSPAVLTYTIQVPVSGMYILMLGFVEPCDSPITCKNWVPAPGQRVFSVLANDQPILNNVDIFAEVGALQPLIKTTVLYISGILTLAFPASSRNAVISLISITGVGVIGGQVQWCDANPGCAGLGLTTVAAQSGTPSKYYLLPTGSPFLFGSSFAVPHPFVSAPQ